MGAILEVFIWIVGGLFIAVVMLLSYALMSINSSTRSYEDELIEFQQQTNKTIVIY